MVSHDFIFPRNKNEGISFIYFLTRIEEIDFEEYIRLVDSPME